MGYKDPDKNRKWQRDNFQRYADRIRAIKEASPCVDCNTSYPYYVMEFDHVRGGKFKGVSRLATYSLPRIQEEIAKCDLVCSNCHKVRTYKRAYAALAELV